MKSSFAFGLALATLFASPELTQAEDCSSCSGCLWTFPCGTECFPDASQSTCTEWGKKDYTWCGAGQVTPPTNGTAPSTFVLSPYIDVGMWTHDTLVSRLDTAGLDIITLAFATGVCGSEEWAKQPQEFVLSTIQKLVDGKKKYIISSGGAAGAFTCPKDTDLITFIEKYSSEYLIGVDFDIEVGQTKEEIDQLVLGAKNAQKKFPNLRFTFTMASYGKAPNDIPINPTGELIMASIKENKLTDFYINLMAMDYMETTHCIVTEGELCDMGASAIGAVKMLKDVYGVPFSNIEVTPMIGGNDFEHNVFTLEDTKELTDFAKSSGLGGLHFWSLDRDEDCPPGPAKANCNSYGKAGSLGFSKAFVAGMA